MTSLTAKPVIRNKFWIVESNGNKIATIQAVENGGVVYVQDQARQQYASIKLLSQDHNVVFDKNTVKIEQPKNDVEIYGYPINHRAYNTLWDIKHHFPVFTKSKKSKSFYCAGYYLIKINNEWVTDYCPKLITLNRHEFKGPFKTLDETVNQK